MPVVAETIGSLSPMRIFAFSLLLTRMRGLAKVLKSPVSRFRLTVTPPMPKVIRSRVRPRMLAKFKLVSPAGGSTVSEKVSGNLIPRSVSRVALISMTSTSSSTSGSLESYSAMRRSAS